MENNNIEDSQGTERPTIPVVNGEATPSSGKAKKVLFSLLTLVLVAGAGAGGYLYSQEKTTSQTLNSQLETANSKLSSLQGQLDELNTAPEEQKPSVPEGFKEYTDSKNKFSLYYPSSWEKFEPEISPIADYQVRSFSSPLLKYDAETGEWAVADTEGNKDYSKGQAYVTNVARKDRVLTLYDFSISDGGCTVAKLVFVSGKNVIELQSPEVCSEGGNNKPVDELKKQTEELAYSIKFI